MNLYETFTELDSMPIQEATAKTHEFIDLAAKLTGVLDSLSAKLNSITNTIEEDAEAVTEEITTEETAAEDLDESQITEETTGEVVEEVVDAPTDTVWVWDIRFDGPDAESWTSLDTGIFFTSKEEAISAALHHLDELADEGELLAPDGESFADPTDFVVDAFEVAAKDIPTVSE